MAFVMLYKIMCFLLLLFTFFLFYYYYFFFTLQYCIGFAVQSHDKNKSTCEWVVIQTGCI